MDFAAIRNLNFCYTGETTPALQDVTLTLRQGELLLVCGPSGSGKTTLLRHLKPELQPKGTKSGEIFLQDKPLQSLSARESAQRIGMLQQDVEAQIVMDSVRAELAFALECVGKSPSLMLRRVAESVSFFGLEHLYTRQTAELSGGEKQLLSLASVMTLHPQLLLLDEPSAQLDPIASIQFYDVLLRLNRELGTTVVLTEQRLEECFSLVDRVAVVCGGRLLFCGEPGQTAAFLASCGEGSLMSLLPLPTKYYLEACPEQKNEPRLPVTVKQVRESLSHTVRKAPVRTADTIPHGRREQELLRLRNISFRFHRHGQDILDELSLSVCKQEILCILGGNGAGKTTLLRVLNGALRPWQGKYKQTQPNLHIAYLPQNPRLLFARDTLEEDFLDVTDSLSVGKRFAQAAGLSSPKPQDSPAYLQELLQAAGIAHLLGRHPYDVSVGELQRAALVKLLLTQPDLLLLDEPTKGLDLYNRSIIGTFLRGQVQNGRTVIAVTHDLEFASACADRCAMLFGGQIPFVQPPEQFFRENLFYTTVRQRIADEAISDG